MAPAECCFWLANVSSEQRQQGHCWRNFSRVLLQRGRWPRCPMSKESLWQYKKDLEGDGGPRVQRCICHHCPQCQWPGSLQGTTPSTPQRWPLESLHLEPKLKVLRRDSSSSSDSHQTKLKHMYTQKEKESQDAWQARAVMAQSQRAGSHHPG